MSISSTFSSVCKWELSTIRHVCRSQQLWWHTSMCSVWGLMISMVIRVRAPWSLQLIGSSGKSLLWMSFCNWSNNFASKEASELAIKSTSRAELATRLSFRHRLKIAKILARNRCHPSHLWSTLSSAQSESEYPRRQWLMLILMLLPLMCTQIWAVDSKY